MLIPKMLNFFNGNLSTPCSPSASWSHGLRFFKLHIRRRRRCCSIASWNHWACPFVSAVSICKKLRIDGKVPDDVERASSVLGFLKSCGYDEARLAKLIAKRPSLLLSDVESTLKPQMQFLRESGVSGSVLLGAMAVNPAVFNKSVGSFLKPQIDFLNKYLRSSDAFDTAIRRNLWLDCESQA